MPTMIEPKVEQEAKSASVAPISKQPELFAAEIEMEGKSPNLFPLILIAGLVIVVGGTIYYFVKGARDVLTIPAATTTVNQILQSQGPATIQFSTGTVVQSVSEKPLDPHYKLLAKGGIVVTKSKGATSLIVNLTDNGTKLLDGIDGVQKLRHPDGTMTYLVPLATRKLVSVDKVTMLKPHLAQVEYSWQWEPNRLGKEFDASGSLVKSFTTWDRSTLIKSYGVDFYSGAPTKVTAVLMEKDNGTWKPYAE